MNNHLLESVQDNAGYVVGFLLVIAAIFAIAYMLEKMSQFRNEGPHKIFNTRKIAMIGMFSAIAVVLMMFEIPVPFAPSFYKLDLSELPILIGTFAFGPVSGVMMEFVKILLKLLIKGTSTAFVGELANFAVGCTLILPASVIYHFHKTRKQALIAVTTGTLVMTFFGTFFNAVYLLPAFSRLYGMPLETLIGMGEAIFPSIAGSITRFVIFCVAPLNLIKGLINSLVTLFVYKKLSPILKGEHANARSARKAKA
ncbi:MAG: ECF transporter S component [Lachnospiraceae bacterium]|nr:ECF transporter S component [Lachnospiraceae bacterium]